MPEQGTEEEFREYADQLMISPHGDLYDASPYLMLRRSNGGSAGKERSTQKTHLVFDEGIWTTRPVRPIGYFSFKNIPAIAFDADNVQVLAEDYELIQAIAGPDVRWTVMEPTPVNPTCARRLWTREEEPQRLHRSPNTRLNKCP